MFDLRIGRSRGESQLSGENVEGTGKANQRGVLGDASRGKITEVEFPLFLGGRHIGPSSSHDRYQSRAQLVVRVSYCQIEFRFYISAYRRKFFEIKEFMIEQMRVHHVAEGSHPGA